MADFPVLNFQDFISSDGGTLVTDSLKVAAVHGKKHKNVLALIRKRISEAGQWGVLNFKHTPTVNQQNGETYDMYTMTQAGYQFLVGKMTGAKAVQHQIAYIEAFGAMAAYLKNQRDGLQFRYFEADRTYKARKAVASDAGRDLVAWRREEPALDLARVAIMQKMQPGLPFGDHPTVQ